MKRLMLSALLLTLVACGHKATNSAESAAATQGGETQASCGCPMHGCSMQMQGSQVSYEDTPDGAAMVFTTESGDVAGLQQLIAKKAEHHNSPEPKPSSEHIPHTARVENVERGARLVMVPSDPSQLDALRAHVKEHVTEMQSGKCLMKEGAGCGCGCGHGAEAQDKACSCPHGESGHHHHGGPQEPTPPPPAQ